MKERAAKALYRVIRWLVWLFAPKFKIVGEENLPEGASVIVGNHSQMYGPIAAEIYTPGRHYTWCIGEMMNRKEVADYAYGDFWTRKPKRARWFYRILSYVITPISVLIFNHAHTVPVYHDTRVMITFRESVKKLCSGARLVIFPECYTEHNNIVHEFQDRFVDVAKLYYRKTGEALSFVPMYLAPRLRTIFYGEPILFDPERPIEEERVRVAHALMDAVTEIAAAQPEHTVVPYPNISKRLYPKNIPVEAFADAKTIL